MAKSPHRQTRALKWGVSETRGGRKPRPWALPSGLPIPSVGLGGISPPGPSLLERGAADPASGGGGRHWTPGTCVLKTPVPSDSPSPSPRSSVLGAGLRARDAGPRYRSGKCQARGAGTDRRTPPPAPAAPPSTPGSSSSSSFPRGGGSRLRKPRRPRPGRHWSFGEAVRAGARHAGPDLPAATSAAEAPGHP